jgi:hypothetical protein
MRRNIFRRSMRRNRRNLSHISDDPLSKFAHLAINLPNYANNQQASPVKLENKPVRIRIEFPAAVGFRFLELDSKVQQ